MGSAASRPTSPIAASSFEPSSAADSGSSSDASAGRKSARPAPSTNCERDPLASSVPTRTTTGSRSGANTSLRCSWKAAIAALTSGSATSSSRSNGSRSTGAPPVHSSRSSRCGAKPGYCPPVAPWST
ncbi:hypothetical protein COSO111634_06575 [Corallococcus soli]